MRKYLIHSSYAHKHGLESNERLEFLGDSVIQIMVTEYLYRKYPKANEGELSKIRARAVSTENLGWIASTMGLHDELKTVPYNMYINERMLAGTFEALVGETYLEKGSIEARKIAQKVFDLIDSRMLGRDYKSELQVLLQSRFKQTGEYGILDEEGPQHNKVFYVGAYIGTTLIGTGSGSSKKKAENKAACSAISRYEIFGEFKDYT